MVRFSTMHIYKVLRNIDGYIAAAALALALIAVLTEVVLRHIPVESPGWFGEFSQYMMIAVCYFGAAAAVHRDEHIKISLIDKIIGAKLSLIVAMLVAVICISYTLLVLYASVEFIENSMQLQIISADGAGLPVWFFQLIIPFGFIAILMRLLLRLSVVRYWLELSKTQSYGGSE